MRIGYKYNRVRYKLLQSCVEASFYSVLLFHEVKHSVGSGQWPNAPTFCVG